MIFLNRIDLETAIQDDLLNQLVDDGTKGEKELAIAEKSAIKRISSFLNQRYVVNDIFPIILEYSPTRSYEIPTTVPVTDSNGVESLYTPLFNRDANGVVINYCKITSTDDVIYYKLINPNPVINDLPPSINWERLDPRDENITNIVIDFTLFYLHRRINPRKIPTLRVDSYNDGKEWLMMVKDDTITPDLPKAIDTSKDVDTIPHGSGNGFMY